MNKRSVLAVAVALMFGFSALHASAQKDPMVGGAAMYPTKNIVENAVNSKDHTTLVAAVKAAGLVDTLEGPDRSRCSRPPMRLLTSFLPGQWIRC